ncbi:MAG: peptide deformylase [Candidatus Njordarchaeales archaeon]
MDLNRKILRVYKDLDPILRAKCRSVSTLEPWILMLCDNMWSTLEYHDALGLAANQVGYDYQIICVNGPEFKGVMINPKITEASEEIFHFEEGCLSMPDYKLDIGMRSEKISVKYKDLDGNEKKICTTGLTSVIIQHEVDHLLGILFVDYLDDLMKGV